MIGPGHLLPTTVVGSYPVVRKGGLRSILDPLSGAVQTAVSDQISAGIDIISDGQVRSDMIGLFSSDIPGIKGLEVIGPVQVPSQTHSQNDVRYALKKHSWVKGIVTGPSTLAHAFHIANPVYRKKEDLIQDLAKVVLHEARSFQDAGVSIIQIDEPILSTGIASLETGRDALEMIVKTLSTPVAIHVCGDISGCIDTLVNLPLDIIDIECAKSPQNLTVISKRDLHRKMLGYGCIDSSDDEPDSTGTVVKRIEEALSLVKPESLMLDPDCGMRMLSHETAFKKLSTMVIAAETVRKEIV